MSGSTYFPFLRGRVAVLCSMVALGVLIRRNPVVVLMGIELMLNAVNIVFGGYGRFLNSEEGQVFAFMVIVVAAAEVVVGLSLVVSAGVSTLLRCHAWVAQGAQARATGPSHAIARATCSARPLFVTLACTEARVQHADTHAAEPFDEPPRRLRRE